MKNLQEALDFLEHYDGEAVRIMEVCGSHTAAIHRAGIPPLLSSKIRLFSGPGCPVCVTPSVYVDRLIELALLEHCVIVTFGDLIRVPGSRFSLAQAKGRGADVRMVYSPLDTIALAKAQPDRQFVFAAVGFETTAPVYALLVEEILEGHLTNVRLLTAMKTMPAVIGAILERNTKINAFLAPGHVSVVTGWQAYLPLAARYHVEFVVAGFTPKALIAALAALVRGAGSRQVKNFYPSVVTERGNEQAQAEISKYFEPGDAFWRGFGKVPASGLYLKKSYAFLDAGSRDLSEDQMANPACCCGQVLAGNLTPTQCPLFGRVCTPLRPQGACMVSEEGSCNTWYRYHRQA